MILTRNEGDAERLRCLALHGMSKDAWKRFSDPKFRHYLVSEIGFKYNMTDLNAAIGIHQMKRMGNWWQRRREIWQEYDVAFTDLPVTRPAREPIGVKHGHHLYTILVDPERCGMDRGAFIDELDKRLIGVGIHYLCLAEHPIYQSKFSWRPEAYPNATRIGRQTVSLPLSGALTAPEVARVVEAVRDSLRAS
jgi:dTDP-4-amino-4,6-dideoxygalactose transaminase